MLGLFKKKPMTDYEMQLWLEKKGHPLYDAKIDNDVDMEELHRLAESYGFEFVPEKYEWIKK